jgi:hypothetical protein
LSASIFASTGKLVKKKSKWNVVILEWGLFKVTAAATCWFGGDVAAAAVFALGRQHLHLIADNIGRVTVISAFVLPFSGLQAPLNINGLAFC